MSQMTRILSRTGSRNGSSMWGTLFGDTAGGLSGWLVDSWTESSVLPPDHLRPKLHWVSKEDGKFYHVKLSLGSFGSRDALQVFDEDTGIEPHRVKFVRETVETWEREYLESLEKPL